MEIGKELPAKIIEPAQVPIPARRQQPAQPARQPNPLRKRPVRNPGVPQREPVKVPD